jgi:hypothetical protein
MSDAGAAGKLPAVYRCAELLLSEDASALILVDGATGERASEKQPTYLDPERLRNTERSIDAVFTPTEHLTPREVGE